MKILVINGSPKKKGGASAFFSKILSFMLFPKKTTYKALGLSKNYESIFAELQDTDTVVFSVPLYVDGIPSHFIHFLKELEQYCTDKKCKFMLYVISNSGFVGGHQNQAHLEQYKCWCERAGVTWGGGLGIGGGVMLHVIFYLGFLYTIIRFAAGIIFNIVFGKPLMDDSLLYGFVYGMIIWLFLNSGMLLYEFILAWAIKMRKSIKNLYTRVMLPSFVFLIVADIFMALQALLHGTIFSLNKKGDHTRYLKQSHV